MSAMALDEYHLSPVGFDSPLGFYRKRIRPGAETMHNAQLFAEAHQAKAVIMHN